MESYSGIVQTARDALLLLEASRIGLIPRIKRRLKEAHRRSITPGQVFIWNEREAKMRRWTDGRSWSASRVTGTFLTYREMETKEGLGSSYKYKADGLIKQSFSITTTQGDKLHLISYTTTKSFTASRFLNKCPSQDPIFADIEIPKELYPQLDHLMGSQFTKAKSVSPRSSVSKAIPSAQSPSSSPIIAASPQSPIASPHYRNEASNTPIVPLLTLPPISVVPRYVPGAQLHASRSHRLYDDTIALRHLDRLSFR